MDFREFVVREICHIRENALESESDVKLAHTPKQQNKLPKRSDRLFGHSHIQGDQKVLPTKILKFY